MNPPILSRFAALIFWFAISWSVAASGVISYGVRVWQTDEDLPHNAVIAICQTPDDYCWIGTPSGLVQFDSLHFKTLPLSKDISVTALESGTSGALWIGSSRGLAKLQHGVLSWHTFSESAEATSVNVLTTGRDGSTWVGTEHGLIRVQGEKNTTYTTNDGLLDHNILSLCVDDDVLWIGTGSGLYRWEKGTILALENEHLPAAAPVRALFRDRNQVLWVAADDRLVCLKGSQWTTFSGGNSFAGGITALHEDRYGTMWVGSTEGLYRVNDSVVVRQLNENERTFERVYCIREDKEGNVWIGTGEGLVRLRAKTFYALTREEGLSQGNVTAVLEGAGQEYWIATGNGLNRLGIAHGSPEIFHGANGELSDDLLSLATRRNGGLWVGTRNGKVLRFQQGLTVDYGPAIGLGTLPVHALWEDFSGNLWVGTSGGLYAYQNGSSRNYTTIDGLPGNDVRVVFQDMERNIWIGTDRGLAVWRNDRFWAFTTNDGLSGNTISAIYEDQNQNLWVGALGHGLNRAAEPALAAFTFPKTPIFKSYSTRDGLFSDGILEILGDNSGNLWMSSMNGIFRVSMSELDAFDQGKIGAITSVAYGKSDGMPSSQCSGQAKPAAWKGKDGRLWFATSRGVALVDPSWLEISQTPPRVVIREIVSDGQVIEVPERDHVMNLIEKEGAAVVDLPPGRGEIQFHFAVLSFAAPEKNRFKYKLEGVDVDWVEGSGRRIAHYNNIQPGHYRFRVTACNHDGIWNETGTSLAVVLHPYFWQTNWFLGFSTILVLGFVAGGARYITSRRVREQLRQYEQQHALERERARIAQDMHDDLGARLTEILLLNERARIAETNEKRIETQSRISDVARGIGQNLNALVWAVSPRNDFLDKTALYLWHYLDKFFAPTPIQCRFDMPEAWPNITLSSEVRHNLFLVIKEAANNIVKHANASEVRCRFAFEIKYFSICIEDNGKGLDAGLDASDFGNGLGNMRRRVEGIGGTFTMESEPKKGTRIQVRIPLQNAN